MNRRDFLKAAGGAILLPVWAWAKDLPRDVKVTRILGFDLISQRSKLAGKNSGKDVHGRQAGDRMVRIFTNIGVEGIGNCRAGKEACARLLGKNPFDLYQQAQKQMTGPLGSGTMPLWDLAGKVLKKPVYQLLGGAGPKRVPVYDGSIYFCDLLDEYSANWQDRFKEEIDMGIALGHLAFKVKVGRGAKWMETKAGYERDIAVIRTIRTHAGPKIVIGVDANNGYDLEKTKQLFEQVGDFKIAFAEEMFEENVDQCLEFKAFIREHNWKTLLADGETEGNLESYKPFIEGKAVDIFQGDMNRFGLEGILTEAEWCRPKGLKVAPHNWGSLVGYYMQLHVGRAITNFYRGEHDPLSSPVLIADGYKISKGKASVPKTPGFGLKINEEKFASDVRIRFDLKE